MKWIIFVIVGILLVESVVAPFSTPTDLVDGDTGLFEGTALWANDVTNGAFWTLMLATFCVILYMSASRYTTDRALAFAGTAGMIGSLMFVTLGLITWWVASIFILLGIGGIVAMVLRERF